MGMLIQHRLFCDPSPATLQLAAGRFTLVRTVKSPHGEAFEVNLIVIETQQYEGQFMWATTVNSANGYYNGYVCLPRWGNFATTRPAAINSAIDEILPELEKLTESERDRATAFLADVSTKSNC